MKDFFKTDEAMIDLMIVGGVVVIIYISQNITPVTPEAVVSGQATEGLLAFFGIQINVGALRDLFLSSRNAFGVLGTVLLGGVFLLTVRISEIKKVDKKKYEPVLTEELETKAMLVHWQVVLDHVNSENPAEWKLAILEADNMLDEILDIEGYKGETLGEKLKAMSPNAIRSYQDLWDAHLVRNQIAHEAGTMDLSKKMARDTISRFEIAFQELGHI